MASSLDSLLIYDPLKVRSGETDPKTQVEEKSKKKIWGGVRGRPAQGERGLLHPSPPFHPSKAKVPEVRQVGVGRETCSS